MASSFEKCLVNYRHLFAPDLLKGKVAFVTGGGSGIGFTITEILMRHGCDTAIASRRLDKLEESAKKLEEATGRKCFPVAMDVRQPQKVTDAVQQVLNKYGKLNILVNNAAGNFLCPLSGMSNNAFKTVMEIDTQGTFNVTKAVYDNYLGAHGGRIINISATLHHRGQVLQAHAGAAKAAIDALTKHMAVEWGPQGITVNGIAPGPIGDTEGMSRLGGADGERRAQQFMDFIPVGRMGRKEEIGHLVVYLVSELGELITGQTIVADGGHSLSAPNSLQEATDRMKSYMSKM